MIRFRVLGSVELTGPDGEEVASVLAQPKRTALLAYLALATPRGFHRRDKVVGLFWPESDHDRARASLRRAIHFLRKSLGGDAIMGRGNGELSLNPDLVWSDVEAFRGALKGGDLEGALGLYRGDLLEGYFLSGCPDFERWLDGERDELRREAARAAWALAHQNISRGQLKDAERTGQRALELNPTDENEIRGFMEALARAGDRAAAMRLYEKFASDLSDDLDLEPSPDTRAVVEDIRARSESNGSWVSAPVSQARGTEGELLQAPAGRNTSSTATVRWRAARWAVGSLAGAVLVYLALSRLPGVPDSLAPPEGVSDPVLLEGGGPPGIVVLPCENASPDPEDAYLAVGIHDEILQTLSRISELRIVGR